LLIIIAGPHLSAPENKMQRKCKRRKYEAFGKPFSFLSPDSFYLKGEDENACFLRGSVMWRMVVAATACHWTIDEKCTSVSDG
jgi:hypothetical protein